MTIVNCIDCFDLLLKGFRGLYKGIMTPLVGVTPIYALCFLGFGVGKKLQTKDPNEELT